MKKEFTNDQVALDEVRQFLEKQFRVEMDRAEGGWRSFMKNLEKDARDQIPPKRWEDIAGKLLDGTQRVYSIIDMIENGTANKFVEREVGLANADAAYHPITMDPFELTICLSGKTIRAALQEMQLGNV